MSRTLTAECPAKVNLALRVLGRRPDGYHELDTLFQAIDLADTLEMREDSRLTLTCSEPALETADNLVLSAARRVRDRWGSPGSGGRFHLVKRIPHGAGLGGGSSDAAAALLLCCRAWNLDPDPSELRALAAGLGADVPFFLTGGTARGVGRGDEIRPRPFAGPLPIVLGLPGFPVSTAEVFGALGRRLTLPSFGVNLQPLSGHKSRKEKDLGFVGNDLEGVVFERWPELQSFRDALLAAGADRALLSGSGSTVYGVFEDRSGAERAVGELRSRFSGWELRNTRAVAHGARIV